jgi:cytoskeletal protein RodZ
LQNAAKTLKKKLMSTVAEMLRQAREAKNLTVNQLAEITKIRTDHIRALEEGNFNVFAAPVYIRGFVRTCATLLKLDVGQTMAALDSELGATEKFCEPPPLTDEPKGALDFVMLQLSKVDWRKGGLVVGLLVLVVVVVSIVFAVRHHHKSDPLSDLKPAVYQSQPNNSGETLPVPAPAPKK